MEAQFPIVKQVWRRGGAGGRVRRIGVVTAGRNVEFLRASGNETTGVSSEEV